MRFSVSVWKFSDSSLPEIQTWVEVADPVTAALLVMDRFGVRSASTVIVSDAVGMVGHFVDVDLSGASSGVDCALLYDYG